jgi:micrococcal nuclease
MRLIFKSSLLLCSTLRVLADQSIPATEAAKHVGEKATVCGVVASANYASSRKGQPTFLNLDKPYPNAIFTALIWGENRSKFNEPEVRLRDKRICTTGKITLYGGVPEMVLRERSQLREEE